MRHQGTSPKPEETSCYRPVQRVREQDRHRVVRVANDFDAFDGEVSGQKSTQRRFGVLDDMLRLVDWPRQSFGTKIIAYPSGFSTRAISCAKTSRRMLEHLGRHDDVVRGIRQRQPR